MSRRLLLKFALFTFIGLAGLSWGTQAKASALICKVLTPAYESSPPKDTDCYYIGQEKNVIVFSGLNASSSDTLKRDFISKMVSFESGQHLQRIGAKYIEARIKGNSNMFWQDRLKLNDVTLSIDQTYDYSSNSGYNPFTDQVDVLDADTGTEPALLFKIDGVVRFAIKIDCGNPLNDMTLPGPPIIRGYKIDDTGNQLGTYAYALISATKAVPSSDIDQPFNFSIRNSDTSAISAAAVNGYKVIGSTYIICNTAKVSNNGCPLVLPSDTRISATNPNFSSDNPRTFSSLKAGHVYDMRWVYQKVPPPPKIVTITGKKVDTSGNTGPFSSEWISKTKSGGTTEYSTANPYSFKVDEGSYSISAANNTPGWEVIGSSTCTPIYQLPCIPSNTPTTLGTTKQLNSLSAGSTGSTVTLNWIYDKYCSIHPTDPSCISGPSIVTDACPNTNIPSTQTVAVALPDGTPALSTGPAAATTSPNSSYTQYNSQNKTKVISVQDVSYGGNRLLSMLNLKSESYQQAIVDYKPFVSGYPYDNNQAAVTYSYSYTVTPYISASSPSYYTCPDGSTPNASHICTSSYFTGGQHTTTGTPTTTYCTQGGTWNGSNCGSYSSSTPTYTYTCAYGGQPVGNTCSYSATRTSTTGCWFGNQVWSGYTYKLCKMDGGTWTTKTQYSCPKGGYPGGSTCYYSATQTAVYGQTSYPSPASVTTYKCTYPYTGGGTSSVCSYYDGQTIYNYTPATAWYNYTKQASYTQVASNTSSGLAMTPCFPRGFSVTDVNANSANVSLNNYENPSSVSAGGYSATVIFKYTDRQPTQGLRQIMTVNLAYSYNINSVLPSNTICSGNSTFTVSGGIGSSTVTLPSSGAGCRVTVPPLSPGSTVRASYSVSPTGSTMNVAGNIIGSNGGIIRSAEKSSGPVVNEPYFKVFGGDVSVGHAFADGLSCGSSIAGAGIFGWNTANNSVYAGHPNTGAGTQFALSSLSSSSLFASNQNNPNAGTPQSPIGLSFANVGASGNNFGTSFGSANCIPDFYSSLPTNVDGNLTGIQSLNGLNGVYTMSSGSIINSSNISPGKRLTIYVSGNVKIDGNIDFVGNYPTINDIPSLIIIAKGNIYISKNVSKLSGIFVAQPSSISGAEGHIYDCASDFAAVTVANSQIYNECGTQLTVNGSFIANKVFLNRTGNATDNKLTSSLRGSFNGETNSNTNATEIFNYGPAFWMNLALPQTTSTGTSSAGYDSIISLPPIL